MKGRGLRDGMLERGCKRGFITIIVIFVDCPGVEELAEGFD